jgi:hypothetical protein
MYFIISSPAYPASSPAGAGLCAVLLGNAAAVAWRQRRSPARP